MTMPGRERRTTLMRVATIACLLLIGAAVAINHMALSRLAEQLGSRAAAPRVDALEKRLTDLTGQLEQTRHAPDALPQARYESDRLALEQRLGAIEQALANRQTAEDLLPLQARMEQLEARLAARTVAPAAARPRQSPPAAVRHAPAEPPFQIVGVEWRADQRFLAIQPIGAATVSHVQLLRPGETEARWRLDTIDGETAVFRRDDQTLHLVIPARQEVP